MSRNMLPRYTPHNTQYRLDTGIVFTCERGRPDTLIVLVSDVAYLLLCQLCAIVLLTASSARRGALKDLTTFGRHIKRIGRMGSQEQVIGSYTRRIVAVVTNKRFGRNWPTRQYPCDARCFLHATLIMDTSIAMPILCPCPFPARIALPFTDTRPEPLCNRRVLAQIRARLGVGAAWLLAAWTVCGRIVHVGTPDSIGHAHGC